MSYSTDISAAIAGLDKWKQVALAVMCAESMSPVIARFGEPVTRRAFEKSLDAAWRAVCTRTVDSDIVSARKELSGLPESNCGDSSVPAHDVMEALSVLSYALGAFSEDDSERWARYSCTVAASCYGGYDYVVTYGSRTRTIDPRDPPPPGRLESLQIQSQFRVIDGGQGFAQLTSQVVEQMRASAARLARELDRVMPTYVERRGWAL